MLPAGTIILILKGAVIAVTVLLIFSMLALARGRFVLHGRINIVVFVLTIVALLGLEVVARLIDPELFSVHFDRHHAQEALRVHLFFSLPAAFLLPFMLTSGLRRFRRTHIALGVVFLMLWTGTFVTGVFFLPHGNL